MKGWEVGCAAAQKPAVRIKAWSFTDAKMIARGMLDDLQHRDVGSDGFAVVTIKPIDDIFAKGSDESHSQRGQPAGRSQLRAGQRI